MQEKKEPLRVVYVQPGQYAKELSLEHELSAMQQAVGGGILQAVYPWPEPVALVCNDEGKLLHMPMNRYVPGYDLIVGSFFICGIRDEDFCSLTDDQVKHYQKLFHMPEYFHITPVSITVLRCSPERYDRLMQQNESHPKRKDPQR